MVSDSDFLTCRHRKEQLSWQVQKMVHPQRDTQADRQLLVGNLPALIQVHTSQAFLDPERQGMSFVHVMRNCWCMLIYLYIYIYIYIIIYICIYMYIYTGLCVCVCVCVCMYVCMYVCIIRIYLILINPN